MFHIPAHKNIAAPAGQVRPAHPIAHEVAEEQPPTHAETEVRPIRLRHEGQLPDVDKLIAYEGGELTYSEVVELFQDGIDKGWVWHMQGHYGRTARSLIAAGQCTAPKN